jgi:Plavaka transposase
VFIIHTIVDSFSIKKDEIALCHADSSFGTMYCLLILGSNKTTVSVATGHVEYHPMYLTIGNPHNTVQCAHCNAVIPIVFLAIPKCMSYFTSIEVNSNPYVHNDLGDCKYDNDPEFRKFKQKLYHASISAILQTLRPGMTSPVIRRYPDGHYWWVIYDLVAFIADYPEQVMLMGIAQGWCPK